MVLRACVVEPLAGECRVGTLHEQAAANVPTKLRATLGADIPSGALAHRGKVIVGFDYDLHVCLLWGRSPVDQSDIADAFHPVKGKNVLVAIFFEFGLQGVNLVHLLDELGEHVLLLF